MKDINKEAFSDFEKAWQQAFEQAEMPVGEEVWNNIDGHLANKDADKYKRKIVFYKWVAAASVVFAISLSFLNYYYNTSQLKLASTDEVLIQNDRLSPVPSKPSEIYTNNKDSESDDIYNANIGANGLAIQRDIEVEKDKLDGSGVAHDINTKPSNTTPSGSALALAKNGEPVEIENAKTLEGNVQALAGTTNVSEVPNTFFATSEIENSIVTSEQRHGAEWAVIPQEGLPYHIEHSAQLLDPPYIYAIPGVQMAIREEKSEPKVMWAGLNVGSGIFDPNFENGSNYQPSTSPALSKTYANARESPQAATFAESTSAGVSYSLGLNFGMRLNEKWVLQSGVQYAYKNASTNSTTYLRSNYDEGIRPSLTNDVNAETMNFSNASFRQEYDFLNSFEFATIPVKAGYLLIDRKVGLMLTAGVGADIFLSNTISENNDRLDDVKMTGGKESPFRDVNFNGLFGAELFYQISRQYHLTLEPSYSIALSPLTKSQSDFRSHPQTIGITAGLKYYWK